MNPDSEYAGNSLGVAGIAVLVVVLSCLSPSVLTGQQMPEGRRPRLSTVLQLGVVVGGPASGLADDLRAAEYDDSSPCFFFCSGTTPHPNKESATAVVGLTIRFPVHPAISVGGGLSRAFLGGATGYRSEGADYIFSRWNTTITWAGVFWTPEPGFRVGAGPASYRLDDDDTLEHKVSKWGLVGEAGFEYPSNRLFFVDLAVRANLIPVTDVDYLASDNSTVVTLRPNWTHVALQVGFGMHL